MPDDTYEIGELARLTGLTVKAVRFYSDRGLVTPERGPGGRRRYDETARARLDFTRTLRELGIDLATIHQVLDEQATLPDVARAHADAIDVQIHILRLRRAVLKRTAERGAGPEEMERMHELARLTAQVEAWVELATLMQDTGFRATMRKIATQHGGLDGHPAAIIRPPAAKALADGIPPHEAAHIAAMAKPHRELLENAQDPRRDRYMALLATINGWAAPEPLAPAISYALKAVSSGRNPEDTGVRNP